MIKKRYILIIASIILTIAYLDLADSFRHIDKIMSEMIQLDAEIKTEIDTTARIPASSGSLPAAKTQK